MQFFYFFAVTAIYILITWSFYLPYRVGQLHFLTVANMTISGYFAAYASLTWHWPFGLVLVLGIIIGAVVGFVISLAIGEAPCFAVVIVGFTFIYITKTVVENVQALGGPEGLYLYGAGTPMVSRTVLLIVAYGLVLLVGYLIFRLDHSRLGRASATVFVDKNLARSFGVNIKTLGMFLQTFASAIGGGCGVLYAFIMRSLTPQYFTFHLVGICMTILFVGGYSTQWGIILASPILYGIPILLPPAFAAWKIVIYGVLLLAVLIFKTEGFITRSFVLHIERRLRKKTVCKVRSPGD
ncbi:MAG: branched-chain amino acid ABC transporter permease [Spirochaetota bacterium]